ncbi:hypothetical protein NM688_g3459 [Phlebia brevispora]|uniref:Uncharacterized protein n=1 Tax=Phlebia brevispora TaxID=194682 RepID=A0ACC1T5M2_9APHY|nr:hypothetical protein NM688_g3459 [Phlebia brevispora]
MDEVWALAVTPDGRYLASGGKDMRVGVWDVEKDAWIRSLRNRRNSVMALTFRKAGVSSVGASASLQLYSTSLDQNINLFDLSVMGYVETLFGHDTTPVLGIDLLIRETVVSAGGQSRREDVLEGADSDEIDVDDKCEKKGEDLVEGSVECAAVCQHSKQWAVFKSLLAHGFDESETDAKEMRILSTRIFHWTPGSWDGEIHLWKLDASLKSFSLLNTISALGIVNPLQFVTPSQHIASTRLGAVL